MKVVIAMSAVVFLIVTIVTCCCCCKNKGVKQKDPYMYQTYSMVKSEQEEAVHLDEENDEDRRI